jgi:hypothetical protein
MKKYDEMLMVEQICRRHGIRVPKKVKDFLELEWVQIIYDLERNWMLCIDDVVKKFDVSHREAGSLIKKAGYVQHPALKKSQGKVRVGKKLIKLYVRHDRVSLWDGVISRQVGQLYLASR